MISPVDLVHDDNAGIYLVIVEEGSEIAVFEGSEGGNSRSLRIPYR